MSETRTRPSGDALSRRAALRMGSAGLAAAGLALSPLGRRAAAQEAPWMRLDQAREIIGDATPETDGIRLDLPLVSEDGSSVPLTVAVESPMTEADHVTGLHLFAPRNPSPEILDLRMTPLVGQALATTRVRLNETQTVVAVARTSTGRVLATAREVRITVSGCLARADTYDSDDEMRTRVRAPERIGSGETAEILTLINHPMETGLREDAEGRIVPQRIVNRLVAELDSDTALEATFHRSLAANPYLRFYLAPRETSGLRLVWTEDGGRTAEATARIAVG